MDIYMYICIRCKSRHKPRIPQARAISHQRSIAPKSKRLGPPNVPFVPVDKRRRALPDPAPLPAALKPKATHKAKGKTKAKERER